MLKVVCPLSNRCTYAMQKVLFEQMQKDKDIDLHLIITSSLLEEKNECLYNNIISNYNCHRVKLFGYTGSLQTMAGSVASLAEKYFKTLISIKPDCAIVIADRFELLPFAIVAAYLNIPLVHIQAFEKSGNIDDKVRGAISALADVHMTSHYFATKVGLEAGYKKIYTTGCPSLDLCSKFIKKDDIKNNVILIYHPLTTNLDASKEIKTVFEQTTKFCKAKGLQLYAFLPNNDPGFKEVNENFPGNILWNIEPEPFYDLLSRSYAIVGNSSAGIREASYFGVTALNIGERQAGRVRANNVIDCAPEDIYKTLRKNKQNVESYLFGWGDASQRIIQILKEKPWEKVNVLKQ